jgi:hypothetical protein
MLDEHKNNWTAKLILTKWGRLWSHCSSSVSTTTYPGNKARGNKDDKNKANCLRNLGMWKENSVRASYITLPMRIRRTSP